MGELTDAERTAAAQIRLRQTLKAIGRLREEMARLDEEASKAVMEMEEPRG